jgi:hypothetical protein
VEPAVSEEAPPLAEPAVSEEATPLAEPAPPVVRTEPAPPAAPQRPPRTAGEPAVKPAWWPLLLAVPGAALVLASLTVLAESPWPSPYRDITIVASLAVIMAAGLVAWRPARGGPAIDAAAAAFAAFPLGMGLLAYLLAGGGWAWASDAPRSDTFFASGVTVVGSLLVLGGALWHPGARAPEPSRTGTDWLILASSVAVVVSSLVYWGAGVVPAGWLLLALLAAAAVGLAAGAGVWLNGRARGFAAAAAVAAPAAGVLCVAAALMMLAWLDRAQGTSPDAGVLIALVSGATLVVAATMSLAARLGR